MIEKSPHSFEPLITRILSDFHEQKISAIRKISVINGSNPCPEHDSQDLKITKIENNSGNSLILKILIQTAFHPDS